MNGGPNQDPKAIFLIIHIPCSDPPISHRGDRFTLLDMGTNVYVLYIYNPERPQTILNNINTK